MASIFLKSCPECAKHISVGAKACSCGYVYDSGEIADFLTAEARARDERLYEEYLRARTRQALEAAQVAAELAQRYPLDGEKARAAMQARLAVEQAEAALAAQVARVAAMKKKTTSDNFGSGAYAAA